MTMVTMRNQSAASLIKHVFDKGTCSEQANDNFVVYGSYQCRYTTKMTKEDILSRARSLDRALYHDRKINGGLKVQAAIKFIMEHRDIAHEVVCSYSPYSGYSAYLGKQRIASGLAFSPSDYDYALRVLRVI